MIARDHICFCKNFGRLLIWWDRYGTIATMHLHFLENFGRILILWDWHVGFLFYGIDTSSSSTISKFQMKLVLIWL